MASSTYKDNEDFALAIAKRTGVTKILLKERGEYDSCSIVCMFSRENLEVAHRAISAAVTLFKHMNPA